MGANLGGLIEPKPLRIDNLKGHVIAIDAYNMLYQFITTIRQQDGTMLMDSRGHVTSHLSGLFSRSVNMLQKGIRPIFVFDGKAPELKKAERQRRRELKEDAQAKYEEAKQSEDVEGMRKFAGRTARLTPAMVSESKELLSALGIPSVQAPSEGEAQVAHIVKRNDAYAGISQDYDSLLHGNPRVVRNLSIAGRRKRTGALGYTTVTPELVELSSVLNSLGVDLDQLMTLAVLVGTDYNIGGVRGIGPKKALALVKKHGKDRDSLFEETGWDLPHTWKEIISTIKDMPVSDDYALEWNPPDEDAVKKQLCDEHDFSVERISSGIAKIKSSSKERSQKGLGEFF